MNQLLAQRLEEIVLANLSNQHFDSAKLLREAAISRYELHLYMKRMKYRNVRCFIKDLRLNKAKEMLLSDEGTAAEIAYRVGFSSPAYFNKCFHEYFGFTPGDVKRKFSGDNDDAEGVFSRDFNNETDFGITIGESSRSGKSFNLIIIIMILAGVIALMTILVFLLYFTVAL